MKLDELRDNWERFARMDPLWAVLTAEDKTGGRWEAEEFFATGEQEVEAVMARLTRMGAAVGSSTALDFGCGVGRLTQALARRFGSVCGVDISSAMIEQAERFNRYPETCCYRVNQADHLGVFETGTFDFVYSSITLQHMRPVLSRRYVLEFLRVLKPGGVLVFQLPCDRRPPRSPGKRLVWTLVPERIIDAALRWQYRRRASRLGRPVMEMYGIPEREVVRLLQDHGATILGIEPLEPDTTVWLSRRYFAKREDPR